MTTPDNTAEVLAISGNYGLLQLPQRGFPALSIQGDSLKCLQDSVQELAAAIASGNSEDVSYPLRDVLDQVTAMVISFEEMSALVGRQLPYFR